MVVESEKKGDSLALFYFFILRFSKPIYAQN